MLFVPDLLCEVFNSYQRVFLDNFVVSKEDGLYNQRSG